jgi:methionine-rich copper-binding protein CopC
MRRLPPVTARLAALALVPGVALALHLRLLGSEPGDGTVLARPPAQVRLVFSQRAEVAVTRLRLVGPAGAVALGAPQRGAAAPGAGRQDAAVTAAVRGPMPPGAYALEWRTMAADGHPVAGRVAFRVAAPR